MEVKTYSLVETLLENFEFRWQHVCYAAKETGRLSSNKKTYDALGDVISVVTGRNMLPEIKY